MTRLFLTQRHCGDVFLSLGSFPISETEVLDFPRKPLRDRVTAPVVLCSSLRRPNWKTFLRGIQVWALPHFKRCIQDRLG